MDEPYLLNHLSSSRFNVLLSVGEMDRSVANNRSLWYLPLLPPTSTNAAYLPIINQICKLLVAIKRAWTAAAIVHALIFQTHGEGGGGGGGALSAITQSWLSMTDLCFNQYTCRGGSRIWKIGGCTQKKFHSATLAFKSTTRFGHLGIVSQLASTSVRWYNFEAL